MMEDIMDSWWAAGDDVDAETMPANESGVPHDIDFIYECANEAVASTWPSKIKMLMGGSSVRSVTSISSSEASINTSISKQHDGLLLLEPFSGGDDRNGLKKGKRQGLIVAQAVTSFRRRDLKIPAAIEMEEPSNPEIHRKDIMDEIILWPGWRKCINLYNLLGALCILVIAGLIASPIYYVKSKNSERTMYTDVQKRLISLVDLKVDKDGPYHKALQWISSDDYYLHQTTNLPDSSLLQRFSMAAVYFAISDVPWIRCGHTSRRCDEPNKHWLGPYHECFWSGVDCDVFDRIISIDLKNNSLVGEFPEAVSFLWELDTLGLQQGQLSGTIPNLPIFLSLRVLTLEGNAFVGRIPTYISQSTSLEIINLSVNKLTGTITPSFFPLKRLYLHENAFQGSLHQLITDLPVSLEELTLYENNLIGSIPPSLARLSNLVVLSLDSNVVTGTIPSEISALTKLEDFAIKEALASPQDFPVALYELTNLLFLDARGCNLRGNLTNEGVAMWKRLRFLYLPNNDLTGKIPTVFSDAKDLRTLDLSGNRLSGRVPSELCQIDIKVDCFSDKVSCPCCKVCCDAEVCSRSWWQG